MNRIRLLPVFLMIGVTFFSCIFKKKPDSVILIVMDTVRQDHLSLYGYPRKTTPFLDRLAKESAVFTEAYSPMPNTLPAHVSLFTGCYPSEHQVLFNGGQLSAWDKPLLAEVLKKQGYQTGAVLGSAVLNSWHGLNRGFDLYEDKNFEYRIAIAKIKSDGLIPQHRNAEQVVQWATWWLDRKKPNQPFFLFLHFWDGHYPYDMTAGSTLGLKTDPEFALYLAQNHYSLEDRYEDVNIYDNEINFIDQNLAELYKYLEKKKLLDNTLIVILSDHGEGLGQHNWYKHSMNLYQEQLLVPLIIRFPKKPQTATRINEPVSLIDIAPTILDHLKIKNDMASRGVSLLPLVSGQGKPSRDCLFSERRWYPEKKPADEANWVSGNKAAAVCGDWKLIWADLEESELFDLGKDRFELDNIIGSRPDKYKELDFKVRDYLKPERPVSPDGQQMPDQQRKLLESLDYAH